MAATLTIGTTTKTLQVWGVISCTLNLVSLGIDTLRFSVNCTATTSAPPWSYGDAVVYTDAGGVVRFRGTITEPSTNITPARDVWTAVASGPWWLLESTPYEQPSIRATITGGVASFSTVASTRVVLNYESSTGTSKSSAVQIGEVLTYAGTCHPGKFSLGSCLVSISSPTEEAVDISCAEAIRRSLRYSPDAVTWWDYSSVVPVLYVAPRSTLTVKGVTRSTDHRVVSLALQSLPGLSVQGVKFLFEVAATDAAGVVHTTIQEDAYGDTTTDKSRVVQHTFQLAYTLKNIGPLADLELNCLPQPAGLAMAYYLATNPLQFSGHIEIHEPACTFDFSLGQRLNVAGDDPAWASAGALAQQAEYDLCFGYTRITYGPPEHLGPVDFLGLIERIKTTGQTTTYPLTQNSATALVPAPSGTATTNNVTESAAAAAAAQATAGDVPAQADTLTQRIQDKLGSFALQAGSGFQMATMDVTATIHGFAEYVASTPPRAYKRHRVTGSGAVTFNGVEVNIWHYEGSGIEVTITPPNKVSAAGESLWVGSSGHYHYGYFVDHSPPEDGSYKWVGESTFATVVDATHIYRSDNGGTFLADGGVYTNRPGSQSANTLDQEDTDADALARAKTQASWSAWGALGGPNTAAAWHELRTTGWSATAKLAKLKGTIRSNIYGYTCRVSIPLYRYTIGTQQPITPTSVQIFDLYLEDTPENIVVDGIVTGVAHSGTATFPEWEIPCEQGFVNLAGSPTVSLL